MGKYLLAFLFLLSTSVFAVDVSSDATTDAAVEVEECESSLVLKCRHVGGDILNCKVEDVEEDCEEETEEEEA